MYVCGSSSIFIEWLLSEDISVYYHSFCSTGDHLVPFPLIAFYLPSCNCSAWADRIILSVPSYRPKIFQFQFILRPLRSVCTYSFRSCNFHRTKNILIKMLQCCIFVLHCSTMLWYVIALWCINMHACIQPAHTHPWYTLVDEEIESRCGALVPYTKNPI